MNKLVIAEKPSVGKAIAAVLGATGREDGCFTGNGYIVSWCFGHLAELASADFYHEKYGYIKFFSGFRRLPRVVRQIHYKRGEQSFIGPDSERL